MILGGGWASHNQLWVDYEHYLHHALTGHIEPRSGWLVALTPLCIPGATPAESHAKKTKIFAERKVCCGVSRKSFQKQAETGTLGRMLLIVVLPVSIPRCGKRHKRSKLTIFSMMMVSAFCPVRNVSS